MSVSFFAQVPVTGWEIICACGKARVGSYDSHAAGIDALTSGVRPACKDAYCMASARLGGYVVPKATDADAFEFNMANVNARGVLDALGFAGDDYAGSTSAEDILGRVLLAQAIAPEDEGTPTFQEGNVIHCGRPEGYLQDRLADIAALAAFAQARGYAVAWS